MMREKDVREALSWPWRAGVVVVGEVEREVRSLRMALDCRRAELKRVFYGVLVCVLIEVVW